MRARRLLPLLALLGLIAAAPATADAAGPTATFAKTDDWGSGFIGRYTIQNGGATAIDGWRLEFDLPADETITGAWSAKLSRSANHYVLTDEPWTHTIAPGGSVVVGFEGTYGSRFVAPRNCELNGQPCERDAAPADVTRPSAPTGLTAGAPTAGTVPLSWQAASDDVGVKRYRVYNGAEALATTTGTAVTVTGLAPATTYELTVRAFDAAGNASPRSNAVAVTTAVDEPLGAAFAPYVDMTLYPQFSLAQAVRQTGVRHFSLAFIVSGNACSAAWGGVLRLDDPWITGSLAGLRAEGGDAIVSFGGAANQELALTCATVDALAAQYQAVIDTYGIRYLDFDIEGAAQGDAASVERRSKAIARVQEAGRAAGRPVSVSLTLPVMPTGLTESGLGVVRSAIANGVDVDVVNVMAMDYFDPALEYDGRMGTYAIQAARSTKEQLERLYPRHSEAELWAMVGVTPMLGINDNPEEIFTTADAAKLTAFATRKGLGRLAMWSANRDAPCPTPSQSTQNTCSGVPDPRWAFSNAFKSFGD